MQTTLILGMAAVVIFTVLYAVCAIQAGTESEMSKQTRQFTELILKDMVNCRFEWHNGEGTCHPEAGRVDYRLWLLSEYRVRIAIVGRECTLTVNFDEWKKMEEHSNASRAGRRVTPAVDILKGMIKA